MISKFYNIELFGNWDIYSNFRYLEIKINRSCNENDIDEFEIVLDVKMKNIAHKIVLKDIMFR